MNKKNTSYNLNFIQKLTQVENPTKVKYKNIKFQEKIYTQ